MTTYKKTEYFCWFCRLTQSDQIQNRITTFNCLINKYCNFKNIYIILYKVLIKQNNNKRIMF